MPRAVLCVIPTRARASKQGDGTVAGLSIQYADGRTSVLVVRPTFGMWTPLFPRLPAGNPDEAAPGPERLDIAARSEGEDVVVDVSLGYGPVSGDKVLVEHVRVTPLRPVRVEKLRAHGVEPVTLSIVRLPVPTIPQLGIECASGALDVRVDAMPDRPAEHRVTIVNQSPRAVHAFDWEMRRGSEHALSGRRRGERSAPLLSPGGADTFIVVPTAGTLRTSGPEGSVAWSPWDRFVITAVLWEDGLVEGSSALAVSERRIDMDRVAEIGRVLARLQATAPQSPVQVREAMKALPPPATIGDRLVRDAVADDVARFEREPHGPGADAFVTWLSGRLVSYGQWRNRIQALWRLDQ